MKKIKQHIHEWKKFSPPDETGGFVTCKCGELRFLNLKQMKKFERFTKKHQKIIISEGTQ